MKLKLLLLATEKWFTNRFQFIHKLYKDNISFYPLKRNNSQSFHFQGKGPVAIILISWNVIFIWETGYWTRAIKSFALFDLLKSLYSDTNILSKYIPSLQKKIISDAFSYSENV